MRVPDRYMFERNTDAMNRSRSAQVKASDELSSGVRVNHPWDDPAAAGRGAAHDAQARRYEAINTAVTRASDELNSVDGALGDIHQALTRARELAVQLSNDTYSAAERAGAAAEVTSLFQSAVATLNRPVAGRYLFGGFKDSTPPFDAAGNYLGDTGVRKTEVAPGMWQDTSIRADIAIKGVGGGVDVLTTLTTFATALSANDTTTMRASIDQLTTAITQVSVGRTQAGSQQAVLDSTSVALRAARDDETTKRANELESNPFEAASKLALAERGLEATIEAVSRSSKLTLVGKL